MHLPMKGKRYADVEAIQKACTGILAAKSCIKAEGDYFE